MYDISVLVFLIAVGYICGRRAEYKHYQSIFLREKELSNIPCFSERNVPFQRDVECELVYGSVVISIDFFKRFISSLRNMVGGKFTAYETLLDRARREAILRMKEQALAKGANSVWNVRLEVVSLYRGHHRSIGSVEAMVYGTAIRGGQYDHETPKIPEGINTSSEHPLKEFIYLLASVTAILLVVATFLSMLTGYVARYIPFSQEQMLVEHLPKSWMTEPLSAVEVNKQQYLQDLSNSLVKSMNLPPDMYVQVHYSPKPNIGAFTTLGGHIVVHQGLIDSDLPPQ